MGMKVRTEKSRRMTSRTNNTPAIGALKMPAVADAAPQPMSVGMCSGLMCSLRAMTEPSDEPMEMIGPSMPADPPEASVAVAVMALFAPTLALISPLFRASDSITSGTPLITPDLVSLNWISPTISPPAAGMASSKSPLR